MAKINHLEMGADVLALQDVQVKKGFMGLTVKLIYQPTNSVIKIKEKEYYYHRITRNGKRVENYISFENVPELKSQILNYCRK